MQETFSEGRKVIASEIFKSETLLATEKRE